MSATVAFEEDSRRALVRLCRPEAANAITTAMVQELHRICERLEASPKILVVTGEGPVFSAGADLREMRERRVGYALAGAHSGIFERLRRLPMPTIAAVNGPAMGGGAELAYACDFRIAVPSARFGQPEAGVGLLAAAGATWRLRELVGEGLANEVLLAGRVLSAEEALAARLVSEVVPEDRLLQAAEALADRVGRGAPVAVRLAKLALRLPREAHPSFDDVCQAVLFCTEDSAERITAFLDRHRAR
jgi:enoyl-CoA hydratase